MKPTLPEALEAELAGIRADPVESVGFGLKAYLPYEPTGSQSLMNSDDPAVTEAAARGGQRRRRYRVPARGASRARQAHGCDSRCPP